MSIINSLHLSVIHQGRDETQLGDHMNRFEKSDIAKIRYLDADFQIIVQGSYVVCAITGKTIAIDELKYWSVSRQEAYIDVQASYAAELQNMA